LPEPNNAEETATFPLTDFEKWDKTAAADVEVSDTAATSKPAKVETAAPSEASTETPKTAQELEDEEEEALPKGLKKRFRKLTGKIRDLETQLASKPAAAAPAAEVKQAVATPPATATDKPKAESFATYEAYIEALNDWQYDQREAKRTAAETKTKNEATAKSQNEAWIEKVAEAKTRHDDWEDVVDGAVDVPMTGATRQTIVEMDRGPDVVHFLASNPEEAKRISKLAPFAQARELGKIEDKLDPLDAPEPTKKAAVTKAPAPAKTVRGSSANDAGKEPDPSDYAAWAKWADKRDAREARENAA
jgi:hypothetical protein